MELGLNKNYISFSLVEYNCKVKFVSTFKVRCVTDVHIIQYFTIYSPMQNEQLQNKLSVKNHELFYQNKSRALSNFYVITLWIIYTIIR